MSEKMESNLENKRAQFAGQNQKKSPIKLIAGVAVITALAIGAYFVFSGSGNAPSAITVNQPSADTINVALADLESGKAKFFDYTTANHTPVRFFAVKSADGKYRAAMDACDTCFHAKKGYRQEGDQMVCNNCGLKFHTNLINEVKGGCNPVGVACTVEGGQLVIKTSELDSRANYFR
ncbi:MAG: DUF2318 domain-containing protein [Acidobacteriota bacterium]